MFYSISCSRGAVQLLYTTHILPVPRMLIPEREKNEGVYTAFCMHSFMHSIEILSPRRWQHRRHLIYFRLLSCHYIYTVYLPSSTILGCLPLKKKKKVIFYPQKISCKNEDQWGEWRSVNIV